MHSFFTFRKEKEIPVVHLMRSFQVANGEEKVQRLMQKVSLELSPSVPPLGAEVQAQISVVPFGKLKEPMFTLDWV